MWLIRTYYIQIHISDGIYRIRKVVWVLWKVGLNLVAHDHIQHKRNYALINLLLIHPPWFMGEAQLPVLWRLAVSWSATACQPFMTRGRVKGRWPHYLIAGNWRSNRSADWRRRHVIRSGVTSSPLDGIYVREAGHARQVRERAYDVTYCLKLVCRRLTALDTELRLFDLQWLKQWVHCPQPNIP